MCVIFLVVMHDTLGRYGTVPCVPARECDFFSRSVLFSTKIRLSNYMGRPKASESVKMIAIQFIKVLSRNECGPKVAKISVNAHYGRKSLHCALLHCIPQMTRGGHYKENRQVTEDIIPR